MHVASNISKTFFKNSQLSKLSRTRVDDSASATLVSIPNNTSSSSSPDNEFSPIQPANAKPVAAIMEPAADGAANTAVNAFPAKGF